MNETEKTALNQVCCVAHAIYDTSIAETAE